MTTKFWNTAQCCVTANGEPAHLQIEEWLLGAITGGQLPQGHKFPTERALASSLKVSRMTLRQALSTLESKGWITRVRGAEGGTFVSSPRFDVDLTDLAGLTAQVTQAGRTAGATVLEARSIAAEPSIARELKLSTGTLVHHIVRVRFADGEPFCIERSYFPSAPFPGMLDVPLTGSLYAVLGTYGAAPTEAVEYLNATVANEEDAKMLSMAPGAAVIQVQRLATDANQRPVEFSLDVYRSDRIRLIVKSSLKTDDSNQTDVSRTVFQEV